MSIHDLLNHNQMHSLTMSVCLYMHLDYEPIKNNNTIL